MATEEWNSLECAYGTAEGVPAILERLRSDPTDKDAWQDAWSNLCHQGTVYSASCASLPYLLEIVRQSQTPERLDGLVLISSILAPAEGARGDVDDTRTEAKKILLEVLSTTQLDQTDLRYALGALAIFSGESELGNILFNLDLFTECPECGHKNFKLCTEQ